jgi:DNA topoisomerase-3
MRLWLAEKSSFGKDLAAVLGNPKPVAGIMNCFDTDRGRVVCASGHLVQLAEPQDYDPKYANWDISHLPIIPDTWRLKEIDAKSKWLESIRKGAQGATEIVVATDAGREGEYIAWLIMRHLGLGRVPKKRLWSSGANQAAIRKSVDSLMPYTAKFMLAEAAQIRAESDWMEGMNLTRVFTKRFAPDGHQEPISIGRVQTAVLAMIVRRQREIREFKPREYRELSIRVNAGPHSVTLHHRPPEEKRIYDATAALEIARKVNNVTAPVMADSQDGKEKPPTLFESSSLQIRAYNLWGWPAEHTEEVAQSLYDNRKLISYPRTDGVHLEDEQWNDVATILGNLKGTPGFEGIPLREKEMFTALSQRVPEAAVKRADVFSSKKLAESGADHHGIIPTVEKANLEELTPDERRLYALIVRQYLAQFYPDCLYKQTRLTWTAEGIEFVATGRVIASPGWKVLFGDNDAAAEQAERPEGAPEEIDDAAQLPPIPNGTPGHGTYPQVISKVTRAPKQYTEGSIIAQMRDLSTQAKDDQTKALFKKAPTIGTKSTWGDTVKKLRERLYIVSSKGKLAPTTLGDDLITFCEKNVPKIVSIETTAVLEHMLSEVEQSKMDPDKARAYLQTRNLEAIRLCLAAEDTKLRAPEGGATRNKTIKRPPPKPFAEMPGGSIVLDIPYDAVAERDAAKSMGAKFNGETKRWHLPKTPANEAEAKRRGWVK